MIVTAKKLPFIHTEIDDNTVLPKQTKNCSIAVIDVYAVELVLPERKVSDPEEFLRLFPEVEGIFIDVIERPIQRPKDNKKRKENYSGKKKRLTRFRRKTACIMIPFLKTWKIFLF